MIKNYFLPEIKKACIGILFVIAIPLIGLSQSVLPNNGFENWVSNGVFSTPANWSTPNPAAHLLNVPVPVTHAYGVNVHSGGSAVRIENMFRSFPDYFIPGLITTGSGYALSNVDSGCAFTTTVHHFGGWYKYSPVGGDTAVFNAYLLNAAHTDTIAHAKFTTNATVSSYTYFLTPFQYFSTDTPALAQVTISASSANSQHAGSVLFVDDIQMLESPIYMMLDNVINETCTGNNGSATVHAVGDGPFTYQWDTNPVQTGTTVTGVAAGTHSVNISNQAGDTITGYVNIGGPVYLHNVDLAGHFTTTFFRPNVTSHIFVDVSNQGCFPLYGTARLVLDPLLEYTGATIAPTTILGDTLIWAMDQINYDDPHFTVTVDVITRLTAQIGDSICLSLTVSPIEVDEDNLMEMCYGVVNSFDPNDKQVYPQGLQEEGFIAPDQKMHYTIRFQNTGNAEAYDIYILDTLDTDLDLQTLYITGASHAMVTEILPGNVLKFRFDDIYLPDSTSDEPHSHGYVMYEIAQNPNLAPLTELTNTGYIYFDYNPPVVTNTIKNTIELITGISDKTPNSVIIYPNPSGNTAIVETTLSSGIYTLRDITGKQLLTGSVTSTKFNLNLSSFSSGIYFITVSDGEKQVVGKVVKE